MNVFEVTQFLQVVVFEWPEDCKEHHREMEYPPEGYLMADVDPC